MNKILGVLRRSVPCRPARRHPVRRNGCAVALLAALSACVAMTDAGAADPSPPASGDAMPFGPYGAYLAGRVAQHHHDYAAATRFFSRTLADDPDDLELINGTMLLAASEGRIVEAKEMATRVAALDANSGIARLVLFLDKVKAGDYAAADADAATLPRESIHRFIAPLMAAWAKAGLGQPAPALTALDELNGIKGFAPLRDFHEALILDLFGRTAEAEAAFRRVLQSSPRANWRTVEALGLLLERSGRKDEAKALYEKFAADNRDSDLAEPALARLASAAPPPHVGNAREGCAEALFDLASVLNQPETTDLALIYARLALDLRPEFPLAWLLVGEVLEAQRRPEDALAAFQAVDRASPYSWSARLHAAADLDSLGRTDEAIAEFKAMAAAQPTRAEPLTQLGDLLRRKQRFAEAVEAYDGAIARSGPPGPRQWTLYYSRGIALERSDQWPRAEADLKRALELQPEQPYVLNYLGYSWVDKGQNLDQALHMIERAVQLRPQDGYVVDSLGWAHYRLGDFAQAVGYLEHAVELKAQDPVINDHLGDVYWQLGRTAEARSQWRRALLFGPEPDDAKAIEGKLETGLAKAPAAANPGTARGG